MVYPDISWNDQNLETGIKEFVNYAISEAGEYKKYYQANSSKKKKSAKLLRVIAIIAGALGGLIPIISQMYHINPAWATVAITVALTTLGLDRFFGFSSAWMRFVTTEMKIEGKILQFRLDIENEKFSWAGTPPTFEKAKTILALTVNFLTEVSGIVQDETNTWVVEFQNVLQKLNEEMNVKADSSKLGGIKITVENGEKCNEGLIIHLEGHEPVSFRGASYTFNNLFPKIYRISVTGSYIENLDGVTSKKQLQDESLVNVTPGAIVDVTLKLK